MSMEGGGHHPTIMFGTVTPEVLKTARAGDSAKDVAAHDQSGETTRETGRSPSVRPPAPLRGSWRAGADAEARRRVMQAPKPAKKKVRSALAVPDAPPQPSIIKLSGRDGALIAWASPQRHHGSPVTAFEVEVKDSASEKWTLIYYGMAKIYTMAQLPPGMDIVVRVRAVNLIGKSQWSTEAPFKADFAQDVSTSLPLKKRKAPAALESALPPPPAPAPGAPAPSLQPSAPELPPPPRVVKTTPSSLTLEWEVPKQEHGSIVWGFTLEMLKESDSIRGKKQGKQKLGEQVGVWDPIFHGHGLRYEVMGLSPGHEHSFRVRAHNTLGTSPPSLCLVAKTLTTAPEAPQPPTFVKITPTSVQIKWASPACDNGMPVTSYKLMLRDSQGQLLTAYEGAATSYKASKLVPGSSYRAAVQAINALGASDLSAVAIVELPVAASPSATSAAEVELSKKGPSSIPTVAEVEVQCLLQKPQRVQYRWYPQTWRWTSVAVVCATVVVVTFLSVYHF